VRKLVLCVVGVLIVSTPTFAQDQKVWIDVNFGVAASVADDAAFAFTGPLCGEPLVLASAYPKPSTGAEFDFGGGYMFTPRIGLGISFTGQAHKDTAGLAITVPHPFFFNSSDTDAAETQEELERAEGGAHISAMLAPLHTESLRVRLFGGPTWFRYKADLIQGIRSSQVASPFSRANTVIITGYDAVETEGTGWGFHVGGDVSWFFTRVVGIGGFVRFSRGSVTLEPEPMSETAQDVTVGGAQGGGGLRLRF
jgi:hypothetical protein